MGNWVLAYDTFIPEQEKLREALCTLGNGYFATRGAFFDSSADEIHYPGTYLAGGYNRLKTEIAGKVIENEDLVNLPNWLPLSFRIQDSDWFQLKGVEILSFKQELNLFEGVLHRNIRFKDASGRISTLIEKRLVHIEMMHFAALEVKLIAENWSGTLHVRSAIDGCVVNGGVVRYKSLSNKHLTSVNSEIIDEQTILLKMQMSQSKLQVAEAARTKIFHKGVQSDVEQSSGAIAQLFQIEVEQGDEVLIEKTVTLFTSRDYAIAECSWDAKMQLLRAPDFCELHKSHLRHWESLWGQFDIRIEQESEARYQPQLILRLHLFHLLQTVSLNTIDLDVGVPARGWHGEAYRGHIFWDELFIFPLLDFRLPKISHALLKYRHRRMQRAEESAKEAGLKGAMFPWQSSSNGREESQKMHLNPISGRWLPDRTYNQRHVNSAIAYNVWRYYQVTGDVEFLHSTGAEMIIQIARFWASLSTYNKSLDRFEIEGVMGPDEYHDGYPGSEKGGLKNNAYTNFMAAWVFCRALEILLILPTDYRLDLDVNEEEIAKWDEMSRKLHIPFHNEGIISQFEGYEKLEDFPWEEYRAKYGDIQRLDRILELEGDTPNRYKVSKQADVLMLFYLFTSEELKEIFERLGYELTHSTIPKNIDYYIARTSNGSTLSRIVHSWVLTRANRPGSWELFLRALESDITDIQGKTTAEGIHLGAMAGTVDLIQRCYTGLDARHDILYFDPMLTENLKLLSMHIHYRGHSLHVELTHEQLKITSRHTVAKKIQIGFNQDIFDLNPGETKEFLIT